jgi:hypothetical protein
MGLELTISNLVKVSVGSPFAVEDESKMMDLSFETTYCVAALTAETSPILLGHA